MPINPGDVRKLAEQYAEAWCARSSEKVAGFFEPDGFSIVNDGERQVGRQAIAVAMQAFFDDFPDLVLHMDDVRSGGNKAIFLWTLEGTNSGPGGTGKFVRISGWQNWRLSEALLIMEADGGYDADEYDRQIREGFQGE